MKIPGLLILLSSLISCTGESITADGLTKNASHCSLDRPVVREAANETGTVEYHQSLQKFCIKVVPAGHYDTVVYGIVCNIPDELKVDKLKIKFSGPYTALPEKMPVTFVGHEYYDLNLLAYQIAESDSL